MRWYHVCYDPKVYGRSYGILKSSRGVLDLSEILYKLLDIFHCIIIKKEENLKLLIEHHMIESSVHVHKKYHKYTSRLSLFAILRHNIKNTTFNNIKYKSKVLS